MSSSDASMQSCHAPGASAVTIVELLYVFYMCLCNGDDGGTDPMRGRMRSPAISTAQRVTQEQRESTGRSRRDSRIAARHEVRFAPAADDAHDRRAHRHSDTPERQEQTSATALPGPRQTSRQTAHRRQSPRFSCVDSVFRPWAGEFGADTCGVAFCQHHGLHASQVTQRR